MMSKGLLQPPHSRIINPSRTLNVMSVRGLGTLHDFADIRVNTINKSNSWSVTEVAENADMLEQEYIRRKECHPPYCVQIF